MNGKSKIDQLHEMRARSRLGGGEARIEAQHKKGRRTARERIDLLLDRGFLPRGGCLRCSTAPTISIWTSRST